MITDEDKERVRQATDFMQLVSETVELRRRGADWWGCCPFHHEKTPSFHINPSTGLWKCFGCGLGGDVYDYVMKRENLEFTDAIRYLADRAGIELVEERGARRGPKRNRLLECLQEAEVFYATMLNRGRGSGPAEGRSYLAGRGFGSAVCRRWKLGYAPGHAMLTQHLAAKGFSYAEMEAADLAVRRNGRWDDRFFDRVMFPIHNEQGKTIAFGGRVLTDAKPKYLNTKETPVFHKGKNLFAFDMAKEHIAARGEAIVCEGYTDVMALHEAGFPIAVAALGTSFSIDHVRTLARFAKRIVCMFDGDAAGQRAAERAIQFLDKSEADLRCVVLPGGQDPAEYLGDHRASDLQQVLDGAEPLMDFVLRKRLEGVNPSTPAGTRMALLDDVAGVLAPLKDSVLLDEYALVVADWLGVSSDEVKRRIRSKPVASENGWSSAGRMQEQRRPQSWQRTSTTTRRQSSGSWSARGQQGPGFSRNASGYQAQGYDQYGAYGQDDGYYDYVPDDYLPPEASGAGEQASSRTEPAAQGFQSAQNDSFGSLALSSDERLQLQAECELLSLMAADPDALRRHADRIATFSWADERHEAIAWAILAAPDGTSPADVVQLAESVVPDARRILSSGRVAATEGDADAKVAFVLNTVELYSTRKKIRELRSSMRSGVSTSENVFLEATNLQRHANELANKVSSGFNTR